MWNKESVLYGILAAIPMILLFAGSVIIPFRNFKRMRMIEHVFIVRYMRHTTFLQLVLVSIIISLGESIFFRGLLQSGLGEWLGGRPIDIRIAILVSGFCYGLMQAVTKTFFIYTAIIGIYLGFAFEYSGNLLVPMIASALYGYILSWYFLKQDQKRRAHSKSKNRV